MLLLFFKFLLFSCHVTTAPAQVVQAALASSWHHLHKSSTVQQHSIRLLQILALAHQLDNNVLRRGVSAGLWDDLRYLLNMLPTADTEGDPRLGMATGHRGPAILAADAAVTALEVSTQKCL